MDAHKTHGVLPLFDPTKGRVIAEPEAEGEGYWTGAPSVLRDGDTGVFYLCYRRRRPRGVEPDRGYETIIASSNDGLDFREILRVEKSALDSTSIEKCSLLRGLDGQFRYYISYVDSADQRWRTDVVVGDDPAALDVSTRREVFTAQRASRFQEAPVEGVKDPAAYIIGRVYYLFLSYVEGHSTDEAKRCEMHSTSDVYNTGILPAPTAYATSIDGISFRWHGRCLPVGDEGSWDGYQSRLGSIFRHGDVWYGFYDGSLSHHENYEEKFGLAQSADCVNWRRITESRPLVTVPWRTGSVRYTDAVRVEGDIYYYYEVVRPDGAHELRCSVVPAGAR